MNKKGWKWLKRSSSTSFRVRAAPESWSKYTTIVSLGNTMQTWKQFFKILILYIFSCHFLPLHLKSFVILVATWPAPTTQLTLLHHSSKWTQRWRHQWRHSREMRVVSKHFRSWGINLQLQTCSSTKSIVRPFKIFKNWVATPEVIQPERWIIWITTWIGHMFPVCRRQQQQLHRQLQLPVVTSVLSRGVTASETVRIILSTQT